MGWRESDKQVRWTEQQLQKVLQSNQHLKINDRYSMPAPKARARKAKRIPKVDLPPMEFYAEERPIRIFLPFGMPDSLNKILRMHWAARHKREEEFRNQVRWELKLQNVKGFRSLVRMDVNIYFRVHRDRDEDNYWKWLKDALKGIVFIDDSPKYVKDGEIKFPKGKPRMEIMITPINRFEDKE